MGVRKKIVVISMTFVLLFPMFVKAETALEQYVIISNESVDTTETQFTGNLQVYGTSETYQIDADIPFDVQKYKTNRVRTNIYSLTTVYKQGDNKNFWVTDFTNNSSYQVNAKLLYSGTKIDVWVNNNQISSQNAEKLGVEFEQNIRPVIERYFGNESDVDGNGKVNILVYDIKDGFNGSGGYIGGYFYGGDLFNQTYSNQSEIFYIDTYPLMGLGPTKDVTASYDTLAHEFQHMVNFNRNVFIEGTYKQMDVWLDEALSMAAEQIYRGKALSNRIDYYNTSTTITNGQSLLNWNEKGDILANYSLSYLFGQYLKIQANQGNQIYKEIINHSYNDYRSVESMIKKYIDPNMDFGQFMTSFRAALLLKQSTGLYGFKGDASFHSLQPKLYTGSSAYLQGGGAIVKKINAGETVAIPVTKGSNITYTVVGGEADPIVLDLPIVNVVSNLDLKVTGKTEANAKVSVSVGSTVIGSAIADSNGNFSVSIPAQNAGTKLLVQAEDLSGNKSDVQTMTVIDKIAPVAPTVYQVSDMDLKISGRTEAYAKIYVRAGTSLLGSGKADSSGNYIVPIAMQKAGTKLTIQAEDSSGNKSMIVTTTVIDRTPPGKPAVNTVGDNQTVVTGKAEVGSTVYIKIGSTVIAQGPTNSNGIFSITMKSKYKEGTILIIYAKDKAGNTSALNLKKVVDKTAPPIPVVNKVTKSSTKVSGKAEANAYVYIKIDSKVIASTKADKYGAYSIAISKQKAGTVLYIFAKDVSGNVGHSKKVTVK